MTSTSQTMPRPISASRRKQHCWECLHLSLVCDSAYPACARCVASGVDCPGYGGTRPVRYKWLTPGTVKSRAHNKPRQCRKRHASVATVTRPTMMQLTGQHCRLARGLQLDPVAKALRESAEYCERKAKPLTRPHTRLRLTIS